MSDINTVIVEDDENSLSILQLLIKNHCHELRLVGIARDVDNAVKVINDQKPDLLFLDIDLPDGSGFDILKQINHFYYEVIFTTVHNKYAVRAFEVSALHYLMKPITVDKLQNAISRFSKPQKNGNNLDEKLKILKESLSEKPQKIMLPTSDGMNVFNISEIVRCEADGNYTMIYFNDNTKLFISKPIKSLNKILSELHFSRVHNSHLINLKFIKKYVKGKSPYLELTSKETIPISETFKNHFIEDLEKYVKQV
jgi:two-component system LytT family response regulator